MQSNNKYTTLESWTDQFETASIRFSRFIGEPLRLDEENDPGGANGRIAQARGDWRDWPTAEQLVQSENPKSFAECKTVDIQPPLDETRVEKAARGEDSPPVGRELYSREVLEGLCGIKLADTDYPSGYEAGTDSEGTPVKAGQRPASSSKPEKRDDSKKPENHEDSPEPEIFHMETPNNDM